jgi:hypothetical protein
VQVSDPTVVSLGSSGFDMLLENNHVRVWDLFRVGRGEERSGILMDGAGS